MNLYIFRHGLAAERDPQRFPDDSRRPLVAKGKERIRLGCDAMRALEISFDQILSSPFPRAAQTAEIVPATLGLKKQLELRDELIPGGDPQVNEFVGNEGQVARIPLHEPLHGQNFVNGLLSHYSVLHNCLMRPENAATWATNEFAKV